MKRFDLQDAFLLIGLVVLEKGIAGYDVRLAEITGGLICFGFVFLIGRMKGNRGTSK